MRFAKATIACCIVTGCAAPPRPATAPSAMQNSAEEKPSAPVKRGFGFWDLLTLPLGGRKRAPEVPADAAPPLAAVDTPRDPQPAIDVVFQVDVYQLTIPFGAVSQSADFWNRLNEQVIDPATYDVLQRNGIRVGEAAFSDWEFFRGLIDQHAGKATQTAVVAREAKNLELAMRSEIPFQNVFYFDGQNTLIGRSFERCDNIVKVAFAPAPRKPGYMRLTLAPVVRSLRKRLEFSTQNNELAEVQFVSPEMFYDCNLRVDVPLESFIVVGGSPESAWGSSIGNTFFVKDGASERQEQVLIIVPRPYRARK